MSQPNAQAIARALGGRRCGRSFIARCPAHDDATPSLTLDDSAAGKVLVHCHAGCTQRDVIAALRTRGLWPERHVDTLTARGRSSQISRDALALPDARRLRRALVLLCDEALDHTKGEYFRASRPDYADAISMQQLTYLVRQFRRASNETILHEYAWWCRHYPGFTKLLVSIIRRREQTDHAALVEWLSQYYRGDDGC
jgi:hypothetical protein